MKTELAIIDNQLIKLSDLEAYYKKGYSGIVKKSFVYLGYMGA